MLRRLGLEGVIGALLALVIGVGIGFGIGWSVHSSSSLPTPVAPTRPPLVLAPAPTDTPLVWTPTPLDPAAAATTQIARCTVTVKVVPASADNASLYGVYTLHKSNYGNVMQGIGWQGREFQVLIPEQFCDYRTTYNFEVDPVGFQKATSQPFDLSQVHVVTVVVIPDR